MPGQMINDSNCTGSLRRNKEACRLLVESGLKALPQAKRKELLRAQKACTIQAVKEHKRSESKEAAAVQHDSPSSTIWTDIPHELLESILDRLDPFSLAAAACVCQSWHQHALGETRWKQFCEIAKTVSGSNSGVCVGEQYRKRFARLATGQ